MHLSLNNKKKQTTAIFSNDVRDPTRSDLIRTKLRDPSINEGLYVWPEPSNNATQLLCTKLSIPY